MRRMIANGALALLLVGAGYVAGRAQALPAFSSAIVTAAQAPVLDSGAWGEFRKSFQGSTAATAEVLAGFADIRPGTENHPPHTHVDEEFIYITEGGGTWSLDGKTYPAKAGDVLYSAPNVSHGLKNTTGTPLKWFVVKWRSK